MDKKRLPAGEQRLVAQCQKEWRGRKMKSEEFRRKKKGEKQNPEPELQQSFPKGAHYIICPHCVCAIIVILENNSYRCNITIRIYKVLISSMVLLYWKISLSSAHGHNNVVKGHAHKLKKSAHSFRYIKSYSRFILMSFVVHWNNVLTCVICNGHWTKFII